MSSKRVGKVISIVVNLMLVLALFLPQRAVWAFGYGTGEIKGYVIDEQGVGATGAFVTIVQLDGDYQARTSFGSNAYFDYTTLDPGIYQLKTDITTRDQQYRTITRTIDLKTGQIQRVDLDFSLSYNNVAGALTETVLPSSGQSFQTDSLNLKYQDSNSALDNEWNINRGLYGDYTFGNLPAGKYVMTFTGTDANKRAYSFTKPISISAAKKQQDEVAFTAHTTTVLGAISGTIQGLSDTQLQAMQNLQVDAVDGSETYSFPVDATGQFQLGDLWPGQYRVHFSGSNVNGSQTLSVTGGQVTPLTFDFGSDSDVKRGAMVVTLSDAQGNPIVGANVNVSATQTSDFSEGAVSDSTGTVQFGLLAPGTYNVSFAKNGDQSSLKANKLVTIYGGVKTTLPFSFVPTQNENLGTVSGTITAAPNQPLTSGIVTITTNGVNGAIGESESVPVHADGTYTLPNLKPAHDHLSFDGYTTRGGHVTGAQDVDVLAGTNLTANFCFAAQTSATTGAVTGTVTDPTGNSMAGVSLVLSRGTDLSVPVTYSVGQDSDEDGTFAFGLLDPGTYTLTMSVQGADGPLTWSQKVVITKGQVTQTTMQFGATPTPTLVVNPVTADDSKVTGTAEPNATITIKAGTRTLNNVLASTSKANADGQFGIPIAPQAMGTVLIVTAKNTAGEVTDPVTVTVQKGTSKAPDVKKILAVNASGDKDSVTVSSLTMGDVVTLYDAPTMGNTLATSAPVARGRTQALFSLPLLAKGGTLYVTVTSVNKLESTRVAVDYAAERTVTPPLSQLHVQNNTGNQDTLIVNQLHVGDVVRVYNKSSNGQVLGTATAVEGSTSTDATVALALPTAGAGDVYVTVTGEGLIESAMTKLHFLAEPSKTPDGKAIQVINNLGTTDVITVGGLQPGDIVKVYGTQDAVKVLATSTPVATRQTTATVRMALPSSKGGSIFVGVTSKNLSESTRVAATYDPEPSAPLNLKQIAIHNGVDAADVVTVTGLANGDEIRVYDAQTGGNELGNATAQADVKNGYVATASLALPSQTSGSVYVSVVRAGQPESTRVVVRYTAEPYHALTDEQIQVRNILGRSDSIVITGLNNGDVVTVYTDLNATRALKTATARNNTATIALTLNATGGTVYVTVKSTLHPESARTAKTYLSE